MSWPAVSRAEGTINPFYECQISIDYEKKEAPGPSIVGYDVFIQTAISLPYEGAQSNQDT